MKELLIGGTFILGLVWWVFFRIPHPKIPPLTIDENDPLMIEAIKAAKESINEFVVLFNKYPNSSQVKVPFQTSTGRTEFLWAKDKEINDLNLTVFLLTPPVTHNGQLDRNQSYNIENIIDWVVFQENEKAKGGFTMRVMFKIAREKWGQLPENLLEEEKKYK